MPGPAPKDPSTRSRRNKTSTARMLHAVPAADVEAPPLPPLEVDGAPAEWHPMTAEWWADVWASPMAPEYDSSDLHGLYLLARLVDASWRTTSATGLKDLLGEIRLQRQCFGLTPIDRRRLQWEIDRGEAAEDDTRKRRQARKPRSAGPASEDPRQILGA